MRERWAMKTAVALALVFSLGVAAAPAMAQQSAPDGDAPVVRKRPPTRLRVRPIYPYRHTSTPYPPANNVDYPGPNAHRECTDALVVENRPSGTVIVPRMRCRWVRGYYLGP
jgi:hypothetical protein